MLMRGEDALAVGVWLSKTVKPGSTVRTARLGGMSYAAPELSFWDENGLTDRAQAVWISEGRVGGLSSSPVSAREPDVVAALLVPTKWSYTEDEALLEWLRTKYSLVSRFPQGNFGEVHVWILKSSRSLDRHQEAAARRLVFKGRDDQCASPAMTQPGRTILARRTRESPLIITTDEQRGSEGGSQSATLPEGTSPAP
jgi:hypothetical protein